MPSEAVKIFQAKASMMMAVADAESDAAVDYFNKQVAAGRDGALVALGMFSAALAAFPQVFPLHDPTVRRAVTQASIECVEEALDERFR